jgi:Glycogen recognition site of AMP-activated protein kinase
MMQDYLISMFIDDELDLDNKIEFVETVHEDRKFKDETVVFLQQEKVIRSEVVDEPPAVKIPLKEKAGFPFWRPMAIFAPALAAAAVILVFYLQPPKEQLSAAHRFVIYQPGVEQVEITGSFTDWRTLPMNRAGASDYWEITIDVPMGEHRFSYILEGDQRLADPTILTREKDDFGGENSILEVNLQT